MTDNNVQLDDELDVSVDEVTQKEFDAISLNLKLAEEDAKVLDEIGAELDRLDVEIDAIDADLDSEYATDDEEEQQFEAEVASLDVEQDEHARAIDAHFGVLPIVEEGGE
jgi:hypothetical protein